jgi:uncharacterized membrane protein
MSMNWFQIAPTAGATFLASAVECVEAATIVLAVGTVRGWRSAMTGAGLGLLALAAVVLTLGPARPLQLAVGILLLLFGMRWLRKAVLRRAGIIALHDEDAVFRSEAANLALLRVSRRHGIDPAATATAFKAVLLEGLEVAFIVVAVSAGGPGLLPASLAGAFAAAALVVVGAVAVRGPLARVPENALKFAVGVVISAFGIFWSGEGLGLVWPGQDLSLPVLACGLLVTSLLGVRMAAQPAQARRAGVR